MRLSTATFRCALPPPPHSVATTFSLSSLQCADCLVPPLAATLARWGWSSRSPRHSAQPEPQQVLAAEQVLGGCVAPASPAGFSASPAAFSAHPALSPARSAVSAPSALASHTQTAAGSGPAGASQPSPHRLASLVAEQGTVKSSRELRPAVLKAGVEVGGWITWGPI